MNWFAENILLWYREHKRDLPWRHTKDPYKIWISEIILQQTRVAQGYDYYCRFIERFPDVFELAEAGPDEVMKYWQGLGYYSRARNLHEAAKTIALAGRFPETYDGIIALKGVGSYTAAAIASFAYDLPYAVIDGNVFRVLSRCFGVEEPIDIGAGKKIITDLANELLDKERPGVYNQALMDFGALQCVPSSPLCLFCPLGNHCIALKDGKVDMLPRKAHKIKVRKRYFYYFYVRSGNCIFLRKRKDNDIWNGLYEFPLIESEGDLSEEQLFRSSGFKSLFGNASFLQFRMVKEKMKHVLSHQWIFVDFYEVWLPEGTDMATSYMKVSIDDIDKFPVSRLISYCFSLILNSDKK